MKPPFHHGNNDIFIMIMIFLSFIALLNSCAHKAALNLDTPSAESLSNASIQQRPEVWTLSDIPVEAEWKIGVIIDSEPSGATILVKSNENDPVERNIGVTPIELEVGIAEQVEINEYRQRRHFSWHVWKNEGSFLTVEFQEDHEVLIIPWCKLSKDGYEEQIMTKRAVAVLNSSLSNLSFNQRIPIYLTRPNRPQKTVKLKIESIPSGADIYTVNEDGTMGSIISSSSYETDIGFAEELSPSGEHKNWWRWTNSNEKLLWKHSASGDLLLSCYLIHEKYEPEKIIDRKITNFSQIKGSRDLQVKRTIQMCTPSSRQYTFNATLDSIPSGASIYRVSSDGTLADKIGITPYEFKIGLAQESYWHDEKESYFHKDWRVWGGKIVNRYKDEKGDHLALNVALYKEGYEPKKISDIDLCLLNASRGWEWPEHKILTVPLQTLEAARATELLRLQEKRKILDEGQQRQQVILKRQEANQEAENNNSRIAEKEEARREYEAALNEYNMALEKLNNAKTKGNVGGVLSAANRLNPNPWAQLSSLALPVINAAEIRDAERDVEIAGQRLERAKARIDHSEW